MNVLVKSISLTLSRLCFVLLIGYSKFCENLISIACDGAQIENHFISLQYAKLYASAKLFVYSSAVVRFKLYEENTLLIGGPQSFSVDKSLEV